MLDDLPSFLYLNVVESRIKKSPPELVEAKGFVHAKTFGTLVFRRAQHGFFQTLVNTKSS